MNAGEIFERFRELRGRFEASDSPGEPLAADFDELATKAEEIDQPGTDVLARKARRYASHIRNGFPPLED